LEPSHHFGSHCLLDPAQLMIKRKDIYNDAVKAKTINFTHIELRALYVALFSNMNSATTFYMPLANFTLESNYN